MSQPESTRTPSESPARANPARPAEIFPLDRAPRCAGVWPWALSLGVVLAILGGLELKLRGAGYRPSVGSSEILWSYHRNQVPSESRCLVLIGASRLRMGFSRATFLDRYPDWTVTNLAYDGLYPLATLTDLLQDKSFHGTILCSLTAAALTDSYAEDQMSLLHAARHAQLFEPALKYRKARLLEESFVVFGLQQHPKTIVKSLLTGANLPRPPVQGNALQDNFGTYNEDPDPERFERLAREKLEKQYPDGYVEELGDAEYAHWQERARRLAKLIAQARDRGVRIALVRYPETGLRWELQNRQYPRKRFWDTLPPLLDVPMIHFQDSSELSQYDCPDLSHLNGTDVPAFTAALLDELVDHSVLPPAQR